MVGGYWGVRTLASGHHYPHIVSLKGRRAAGSPRALTRFIARAVWRLWQQCQPASSDARVDDQPA